MAIEELLVSTATYLCAAKKLFLVQSELDFNPQVCIRAVLALRLAPRTVTAASSESADFSSDVGEY